MKKINLLFLVFSTSILLSSTTQAKEKNKQKIIKVSELKAGDQLGKLKISKIEISEETTVLHFAGDVVIDGKLSNSIGPTMFYIDNDLFDCKVDFNGNIKDLSKESIALTGGIDIKDYLPKDALKNLIDGETLTDEYKNMPIKIVVNNLSYETNSMFNLCGNLKRVKSINGKTIKPTSNKIQIENIKKGTKIERLTVSKLTYVPNEYYNIKLDGKFTVSGNFTYNEFEDQYQLELDQNSKFNTKILIAKKSYDMCNLITFRNVNKLKAAMNKSLLEKSKNGKTVKITCTVMNLEIGTAFDKGMLGLGTVDFIELK